MRNFIENYLSNILDGQKINESENLLGYGINSIHLMKLISMLKAKGIDVSFIDLIKKPTIKDWVALTNENQVQNSIKTCTANVSSSCYELTDMQKAYLMGRDSSQPLGGTSCHAYVEFDPEIEIDINKLNQAYQLLLQRHDALRTKFYEDGRQEILPYSPNQNNIITNDFSKYSNEELKENLIAVREKHSHKMLDIYEGQVIELLVSIKNNNKIRIHLGLDLLVADVISFKIILNDLISLYHSPNSLKAISWDMQAYLSYKKSANQARYEKDKSYWIEKINQMNPACSLPLKTNPRTIQGANYRRLQFKLTEAEYGKLKEISRQNQTTIAMTLLALYSYVISRFSSKKELLMNLPIFNRDFSVDSIDLVVADFTDLVLVSINSFDFDSIYELVDKVQKDFYESISHNSFSGIEVEKLLSSQNTDAIIAPIVFSCTEGMEQFSPYCTDFLGKPTFIITQTPQVFIDFQVFQTDRELMCIWDTPHKLFHQDMLEAMFTILEGSVKKLIEQEGILSKNDLENLVTKYVILPKNQPSLEVNNKHLLEGIYRNFLYSPNDIAVIDAGTDTLYSYQELGLYTAYMASALTKAGVKENDKVSITVNRGIREIISILAVLTVGACYVPITPKQPAARRESAMSSMKIAYAISDHENLNIIPDRVKLINFELKKSESLLIPACRANQSAYVILTSGTTGVPKGVEITHTSAMNTISEINNRLKISKEDSIINVSSIDFDLSVYDIFGILGAGGQLIVLSNEYYRNAEEWLRLVQKYKVSLWNSVPLLFDMLLTVHEQAGGFLPLNAALLSGDWVSTSLYQRLRKINSQTRFISLGGATEASIWSNWYEVKSEADFRGKFIPYGWALKNQSYIIVDDNLDYCPIKVPGQLLIGGLGLAKGYCEDPSKTNEKFITIKGERWYKTGDKGYFDSDGCINFLGRIDKQCKVRGHRIELGEIENHLRSYFNADLVHCWPCGQENSYNHLEACVYKKDLKLTDEEIYDLVTYLKSKMPGYMIPTIIYADDQPPLNSNGKFDRKESQKNLQDKKIVVNKTATSSNSENASSAVSLSLSEGVKKLWCENLELKAADDDSNYFFQGGDSLKAIKLCSSINKYFDINLSTAELLESQTLKNLTIAVSNLKK